VPGVLKGAAAGTGRGKEVLSVVRNCDLVVFVLDVLNPEEQYDVLKKELYDFQIRVNARKPDVKIKKKAKDGISISSTVKLSYLDKKTIEGILREFKISNADIVIRDDITPDELIDCIEGNKHYVPAIMLLNKIDMIPNELVRLFARKLKAIPISAEKGKGIEKVKERIFDTLSFIRIYMKEVGKKPDLDIPLIVKSPATIRTVCEKIHKDFVKKFKYARVWGKSAKFPGQKKSLHHSVQDEDIVEIHLK
jgi:ribosome-interacting GTPase 1